MDKLETLEANVNNKNIDVPSNDHRCGLTPAFWEGFAETYWEKEAFVKREGLVKPPITEEELFKCVVDMSIKHCEVRDAGGDENDVRVYVEGIQVAKNYDRLFPKLDDRNFADYSKRITKILDGQPFAFVIDEITMPPSMKTWTHSFLKGMYKPLGAISQGSFWSIFFGNYTSTPYGVHDHSNPTFAESAFYFPIVGEKEMIVWRPDYVNKNKGLKGAHQFAEYLDGASHLLAKPGGMLYWPSDRWHVGSSEGGDVSIVLAVKGFSDVYLEFLYAIMGQPMMFSYKPSGIRKWVGNLTESFLFVGHVAGLFFSKKVRRTQVRNLPCDVDDLQTSAQTIPDDLQKIGRRLNLRFYFGKNIDKALSVFWLSYLTNLGAESQNDWYPPIKLSPDLRVRRSGEIVLLWRQVDSETLLLVADRYSHEVSLVFLPLIKYVADMEAGQEIVYDVLVDLVSGLGFTSKKSEEKLEGLLTFLGMSGTLR